MIQLIFEIGILELATAFFMLVNIIAFILFFTGTWRTSWLVFFALASGGLGACVGICVAKTKRKVTTRPLKVVALVGLLVTVIPAIHIIHAYTLDRSIRYVEIDFHDAHWPAELDGYRIAFITDLHGIPDASMRAVADELNARGIDLLLLGGDFSMRGDHYLGTLREISRVDATDGIFGVDGNHDVHRRLFPAMHQYGIRPLDNKGVLIRNGFFLAGVQDLWHRNPNIARATQGAEPDDFILLLTHNPDVSMQQPTAHIDLILAGHTHAGQITFLGYPFYLLLRSITEYGTRFGYGFAYSADCVPVFTSSGIGVYYTVPRIFARPEVVIFTMYNDATRP
ncbi:MAG: metallophosphoesterase [Defluviitaleaceae bacterium]|nr:metallophosphoesterase [Defluviitaleaceae bacterium]